MAQYVHLQASLIPSVSIYKRELFFALIWTGEGRGAATLAHSSLTRNRKRFLLHAFATYTSLAFNACHWYWQHSTVAFSWPSNLSFKPTGAKNWAKNKHLLRIYYSVHLYYWQGLWCLFASFPFLIHLITKTSPENCAHEEHACCTLKWILDVGRGHTTTVWAPKRPIFCLARTHTHKILCIVGVFFLRK